MFQNKEKTLFWSHFVQRNFFLKTLALCNCRGPAAFKCQRYRTDWSSNQELFHHYQHTRTVQSICSTHQINCEVHLIIIKVTINFPKFVAACKKNQLISSIHSWDRADFRATRPTRSCPFSITTTQKTFGFYDFLSIPQKSVYSINSFLRYNQF